MSFNIIALGTLMLDLAGGPRIVPKPAELSAVNDSGEMVSGAAQNSNCSNSTADFIFTTWRYQGGAYPFPGMVLGETKLTLHGEIVGQTIDRMPGDLDGLENGDSPMGVPWTVSLRFIPSSKRILARTGNRDQGTEIYAQKVEVKDLAPATQGQSATPQAVLVICDRRWDLPRP